MNHQSEIGEAVNAHPHQMELKMLVISALMALPTEHYKAFEKGMCRRIKGGANTNPYCADTMPTEFKQWRKGYNAADTVVSIAPAK